MALSQLGSLNALEQTGEYNKFWHKWIGGNLPSADTISRIFSGLDCNALRRVLRGLYSKLKRNKALRPAVGGKFTLIIDGHESSCSYLRNCPSCLKRTIHTIKGDQVQYYHRSVMAMLWCDGFYLPLDIEPNRPGEGEVFCAIRLLKRVIAEYPRAFDLILVDGLYVKSPFFKLALKHGKDVIAVLKEERRDLLKDARGLFKAEKPIIHRYAKTERKYWDIEHFTTWSQIEREVRVVRSLETRSVRRQKTGKIHYDTSEWIWVSTISQQRLSTEDFVNLARGRWKIENNGFNELINYWHVNHVYCHSPTGIQAFWLLTMLAYLLFHAFINRNLKSVIRIKHTKLYWVKLINAELYNYKSSFQAQAPP